MVTTIIDFEKHGNIVRFYLGDTSKGYHGDDWDDRPYEHNAGTVYGEFVDGWVDIAFKFDTIVLEPAEDYSNHGNSQWCKDDMVDRKVPCIAVLKVNDDYDYWRYEGCFNTIVSDDRCLRFYFGDDVLKRIDEDREKGFHCIMDSTTDFVTRFE